MAEKQESGGCFLGKKHACEPELGKAVFEGSMVKPKAELPLLGSFLAGTLTAFWLCNKLMQRALWENAKPPLSWKRECRLGRGIFENAL